MLSSGTSKLSFLICGGGFDDVTGVGRPIGAEDGGRTFGSEGGGVDAVDMVIFEDASEDIGMSYSSSWVL